MKIRNYCLIVLALSLLSCKKTPDENVALISIAEPQGFKMKIAMVQTNPDIDIKFNLKRGDEFCRNAKEKGADIVVFPEMFSIGFSLVNDLRKLGQADALSLLNAKAVSKDGTFITHFKKLALVLDMAILITYLEKRNDEFRNTATLFDRHGNEVITYSKIHTLDQFKTEVFLTPGEDFYVGNLDIRGQVIRTGVMICYDREFPESARILMLKGAELVLTPNACSLDSLRINQFQTRA